MKAWMPELPVVPICCWRTIASYGANITITQATVRSPVLGPAQQIGSTSRTRATNAIVIWMDS